MKMYKKENYNPTSGCLMLLISMPIFYLLYVVIKYFQEQFAYTGGFWIFKDLSANGWSANWVFIVLTIVASYFQTLITSQDARTAWQGMIMTLIFPLLFISLPSGVLLYYTTNTVLQLFITYFTYKKYKLKGLTNRELWGIRKKG